MLLLAGLARAQSPGLSTELLSPAEATSGPGEAAVISLKVSNTGSTALSVSTAVTAPEEWSSMVLPESLELAPGAQEIIFYSLNVPNNAPAGRYDIAVSVGTGSSNIEHHVGVRVTAVEGLRLVLTEEPRAMMVAGTDISGTFSLSNLGNVSASVTLVAEAGSEWTAVPSPAAATLQPGETTQIKVALTPPNELHNLSKGRATLKAYTAAVSPEAVPAATGSFNVDVLPSPAALSGIPEFATLEGSLRSSMNWQEGSTPSLQHTLTLGGALSPMQNVQFDASAFSLRSDNVFNAAQRFHLRWDDLRWGWAQAGDLSVSLRSQLLAYSLSGRGVDLGLGADKLKYHLFYSDPQDGYGSRSSGAEVERAGRKGRITLLALRQEPAGLWYDARRPVQQSAGLSLHGEYKPSKQLDLTGEAALYNGNQSGADQAYRVTARYSSEHLSGGADYVYAGPEFYGSWSDTQYYQADLSINPSNKLRLWGNYNKRQGNLSRDPAERGDDQSRWQVSGSLNIGKHMTFRVSQAQDWRGDRIQHSVDEHNRRLECELGRKWRNLRLSATWQDETRSNRLAAACDVASQLRLLGTMDISRRARMEFEWTLNRTADKTGGNENSTTGRLGGEFKLSKSSDLSLETRSTWGEAGRNSTWLQGAYTRELAPGRELNVKLQHNAGDFGGETAIAAEYSVPVKLPVKQFPITGAIEGQVSLSHDATQGLAGVLVRVDQALLPSDPFIAAPGAKENSEAVRIEEDRQSPSGVLDLHPHEREAVDEWGPQSAEYLAREQCGTAATETQQQRYSVPGITSAEALTDETGKFCITGLLPGEYGLQLDAATLGVGMSVAGSGVQRIEVVAGQSATTQVAVLVAASISGMIQIEQPSETGLESQLVPLTDAVLELSTPSQKKYRVSGPGGRFSFSELPAGHYELRVRSEGLPDYSVVDPEVYQFDLTAGELKSGIVFTVRPMEREIEITTEQD